MVTKMVHPAFGNKCLPSRVWFLQARCRHAWEGTTGLTPESVRINTTERLAVAAMLTALLASSVEALESARQSRPAAPAQPAKLMVRSASSGDPEKARRFRELALPHLDDVYTLARYLLRDSTDAEDAAHECYVRALRHFDSYRGPAIKPWLFAILRNICRGEFARRS